MDHGIIFLLGVYLLPLAFVSAVGAWADGRRPHVAAGLIVVGVALVVLASVLRPEGVYALSDIPALTIEVIVKVWRAF